MVQTATCTGSHALPRIPLGAAFVYRIYGDHGTLLYVGMTCDVTARLGQHAVGQPWWATARRVEWDMFGDVEAAAAVERRQIRQLRPLHNRTHNRQLPPPVQPCDPDVRARAAHASISPFDQVTSW